MARPFVHHGIEWQLAMTGGIAVAVAELARLPLAVASRVHPSGIMRFVALFAVLLCCGLTVKSMANVLQQAYAPRLHLVQETTRAVKNTQADLATIAAQRGSADAALAPLQARVDEANQRIEELNARIGEQGKAPATVCSPIWKKNKKGKSYKAGQKCSTPKWIGQQFADQLPAAMAERDAAILARDAASGNVSAEVERIAQQEKLVTAAKAAQREAITDSQVHGFAAMLLAKDPVDVTETEISWLLQLYVFLPSIFIAVASTLLAMAAYVRLKPSRKIALDSPAVAKFFSDVADARIAANANSQGASA